MIERKRVQRRKTSGPLGGDKTEAKASPSGGPAGQILRLQASAGNKATVAMLSRSTTTPVVHRWADESESKEDESNEGTVPELQVAEEQESSELEGDEDKADQLAEHVVQQQAGPGSEEAKTGDAGEVAQILALAEEVENGETESEDDKLDEVAPEQLLAVEEQLEAELESDELEAEEVKELGDALDKVKKLKAVVFARLASKGDESESKDVESEE
jgi:hypothetical protein